MKAFFDFADSMIAVKTRTAFWKNKTVCVWLNDGDAGNDQRRNILPWGCQRSLLDHWWVD